MARTVLPHGVVLPAEYSDDWYDDMTSNLSKLDEVIGSDADKLSEEDVGAAALSNDYTDLDNRPDLNPYDQHLANTEIHVTSADKQKWNDNISQSYVLRYASTLVTPSSTISYSVLNNTDNVKAGDSVIDSVGQVFLIASVDTVNETVTVSAVLLTLALDANVMHLSGNETTAGIKTFSDDIFVKSLNFTREVVSPSSSNVAILPIIATITYSDQSPSQSSILNLRISADGSKTLYPNENGSYSLGLVSRNWDNVFSYMFEAFGKNIGNEFSNNARTNLYLKANRDTGGQSGVYVSRFRQNRAQGEMGNLDVVQVTFDVLENSVRTNRTWYLNYLNWENDVPKTVEVRSLCEKVDYKLTHINDLNPGALSLPDTSNALDISGYITDLTGSVNTYIAPVNGYVSIRITGTAMRIAVSNGVESSCQRSASGAVACYVPVVAGETVSVYAVGTSINNATFRPCLGNV